ncbi:MAG: NAD(P)H-hydrate dehydratase [Lysobacterales bacterium]
MVDQAQRLYTAAQVRRLDAAVIEGLVAPPAVPGIELMERAGRAAFEAAARAWPDARRWLVFCGAGNNGGDGYIVARLARQAGREVMLCALKEPATLSGDAATAARGWREAGGQAAAWPLSGIEGYDLICDALLGTGLDREPTGAFGEVIEAVNRAGRPVLAVDIPSGLQADTGVAPGRAVRADLTVTFIGNKRGLFTADGPDCTGAVHFADLQTPDAIRDSISDSGILIQEDLIERMLPRRPRNTHKGSFGWVLGVGSDLGMSGAVRLCGEAALRSGAGKVTLVTRPEHAGLINLACPELMVRGMDSGAALADLMTQVDALVAGPGLGRSGWSRELFSACLASPAPLVLDADGLNLLAELSASLPDSDLPRGRWILTPHPAEAGRLLGRSAAAVQGDRVMAAQELAQRFDAVVVLKGCGTVVAAADGRYAICPLGNPGMATAGSGDVLSGVIGGILAQGLAQVLARGLDCWDAATIGVVAHAWAGDLAAAAIGERGLLASDITRHLPAVLNPPSPHA